LAKVNDAGAATGGFMRRYLWWILLLAVLVGAGAAWLWWRASSERPRYVTAPVTFGKIQRSVSMTGALNPRITVQVGSYVSGPVKTLTCDYNTEVVVDQICATIDPVPFQLIVDQNQAQLGTAEAQLKKDVAAQEYAKIAYERDAKLLAEGTVSQEAVDNDRSVLDQANAQIGLDKAGIVDHQALLKAAEVNLAYTNIRSPVVGTVITRSIDVGQTVAASLTAPTLFIIGKDLTKMQVDTNVSEADVGGITVGQDTYFTVQAYPTKTFNGKVIQIRHGPISVQNVVTYDVVVAVDNPDRALFPGMTADAHIVTDEHDNVLRVPLPAVRFSPGGIGRSRGAGGPRADQPAPAGPSAASSARAGSSAASQQPAPAGQAGAAGAVESREERRRRWANGEGGAGEGRGQRGRRNREGGGEGGPGEGRLAGGHRGETGGGQGGAPAAASEGGQRPHREPGAADSRRSRVWVLRDGTLHPVDVTIGLDDGTLIEVSGPGLHAGDIVVVNEVSAEQRRPGTGQGQGLRAATPGAPGGGQGGPRL
jgi:HlyD family secretion protein